MRQRRCRPLAPEDTHSNCGLSGLQGGACSDPARNPSNWFQINDITQASLAMTVVILVAVAANNSDSPLLLLFPTA
jgi:hypothetical protein